MTAHPIQPPDSGDAARRDVAARWIVREDRGLSAAEAAELSVWLAADPRNATALEDAKASWQFFRQLGTTVRRAPEGRPQRKWPVAATLAAAAAVAVAFLAFERRTEPVASPIAAAAPSALAATQTLPDGSVVRLKDGAQIVEAFTADERRIQLVRGEALFTVVKDRRPFLVEAGGATVRAVGTAFAVRYEPKAIDVVVTEGVVQVTPPAAPAAAPLAPATVSAGNRAVVAREPRAEVEAVKVSAISADEIERTLAWSERMLELDGATLAQLVAEFSRRSGRRLEIGDAALATVRIGGRFPVDDVDGFVRALEQLYHVSSERRDDGTIVLRSR